MLAIGDFARLGWAWLHETHQRIADSNKFLEDEHRCLQKKHEELRQVLSESADIPRFICDWQCDSCSSSAGAHRPLNGPF